MTVSIKKENALASLSLTPLIDVVFLLLIFFLVATRFDEEERELNVMLPSASEAVPLTTKPDEMFINIDQNGQYVVTGKSLTLVELYDALKRVRVNNPISSSVIIRADKRCPWEFVVAALNACQKNNIRNYRAIVRENSG